MVLSWIIFTDFTTHSTADLIDVAVLFDDDDFIFMIHAGGGRLHFSHAIALTSFHASFS